MFLKVTSLFTGRVDTCPQVRLIPDYLDVTVGVCRLKRRAEELQQGEKYVHKESRQVPMC